ncbi:O-acyltransferase like protein isoform X1 [Bombyx mori]|uniref:O-acyltransferase like protein isoform X1 n=1 Tax=Bombyx mori TaxID=7091 RepID=UPI002ED1802E
MATWRLVTLAVVCGVAAAGGHVDRLATDEQYAQFPTLFQLDDYHKCLGRPEGLYCVGTFNIRPLRRPDPLFDMLKDFSKDTRNFNRTRLHRGYCVNTRCGALPETNTTLRFERCVAQWGRKRGMQLSLQQLQYCRTHVQEKAARSGPLPLETSHRVFLAVIAAIVFMNFIGTVYDMSTKDDDKKSKLLSSWSIRSNWQYIVGPYPDGDPRLAVLLPVQAFRTIMLLLVIMLHVCMIHVALYIQNPEFIERTYHKTEVTILRNGSSSVQMFFLLSSFLMAQGILHSKEEPSLRLFFKLLLKRIVRISPVYLLVIGFASTWWPLMRGGPLWPVVVEAESAVCRRKFWAHAFFYNNFFDDSKYCQTQTWFLAVDMQLHALGLAVVMCTRGAGWGARRGVLWLLGTMFLASCLLNTWMAYVSEWQPLMFVSVPENVRTMFSGEPTFSEYYTKPWGSLPASLLGLLVAHLHHHLYQRGFKPEEHKGLIVACQSMVPVIPAWVLCGNLVRSVRSRGFIALYMGLEAPVLCVMAALLLFGAYNGSTKTDIGNHNHALAQDKTAQRIATKGYLQHVFCWRGWFALGRLSLSALMLHWCVYTLFAASVNTPVTSSVLHIARDTLATAWLTYGAALPLTLLVEAPALRLYSALVH